MGGRDPVTGAELALRTARSSTAAFDLTFSAPKSLSVLFAAGDDRLAGALVAAHEEAVNAALGYLEREACRVRRGHNGTSAQRAAGDPRGWQQARPEPAAGFVAAAYRHRMSRAQDPQLHTHVVVANMAQGADGRWTALDGRPIFRYAKAAGCLYEAHLRRAVIERLPWASWGPVREGIAELEQVPEAVREEFSQRRRRILEREAELEAAGLAVGPAGRERIAFDTREPKREVVEADWRAEVRARAAEHGLGQDPLDRLARRTLGHPEIVQVSAGLERRFTTRRLLRAEQIIVGHAVARLGKWAAILDVRHLERTFGGLPWRLSDEQAAVVARVALSGNRIDVVEALAGTGKTTCAAALREVYERAGHRVLGAAPTARAVRELKDRAGITDARTLDAWALALERDPEGLVALDSAAARRPGVVIIDEAGMASTRVSARLIERAMAANVKVIAIGDSGQLSSVQAGGWLGALTRRIGAFELQEVMRQRDPQERRALAGIHRGWPESYLRLKQARGELDVHVGQRATHHAEWNLVSRWFAVAERCGETQTVMICRDNARRERLNGLARALLRGQDRLGEDVEIAGRRWAVGDQVIARRNDRSLDVDNGMRGTITALDDRSGATIRLETGATRRLDPEYLARHAEHAYAVTGHGMQGGTVDWAGVIGRPGDFSRNWAYTTLSRAREPVELVLVDEPTQAELARDGIARAPERDPSDAPLERMARRMRERDDEDLALEQIEGSSALTEEPPKAAQNEPPGIAVSTNEYISPGREEIDALRNQLDLIREQLEALPAEEAGELAEIPEMIAAIRSEQQCDRRPRRRQDRSEQRWRTEQRERRLEELAKRDLELSQRIPDPEATRKRGEQLAQQRHALSRELRTQLALDLTVAPRPTPNPAAASPGPELTDRDHRAIARYVVELLREERESPATRISPQVPTSARYVKAVQLMDRYQVSMKFIRSHATQLGATRLSDAANSKLRYHLPTADAFIASHRKRQAFPRARSRGGARTMRTPSGAPLVPFT